MKLIICALKNAYISLGLSNRLREFNKANQEKGVDAGVTDARTLVRAIRMYLFVMNLPPDAVISRADCERESRLMAKDEATAVFAARRAAEQQQPASPRVLRRIPEARKVIRSSRSETKVAPGNAQ